MPGEEEPEVQNQEQGGSSGLEEEVISRRRKKSRVLHPVGALRSWITWLTGLSGAQNPAAWGVRNKQTIRETASGYTLLLQGPGRGCSRPLSCGRLGKVQKKDGHFHLHSERRNQSQGNGAGTG